MLKGMTAEYLLRRTFTVKPGDTVLFHAAAGGVGLIAGQWAKHLGATVIGTAGSADKVALAKANGYDHVINYRDVDFVAAVKEITGGKTCDVVYDSVGNDTFPGSLDCLRPRGMFGSASASLPGQYRRSASACWRRRARCMRPGQRCSPTSPSAANLEAAAPRCLRYRVRRVKVPHQSALQAGRCRPAPMRISKAAGPPGHPC